MGKGIKTRNIAEKGIKAIDKAAVASERMKEAYIRTRDRLTVYRIASNAEGIISLRNQRNIISARTIACRHCRRNLMGTSISSVNPMVFKYQRLMAMFLCAKCSSNILTAGNGASALVIKAQDGWHTVPAGGSFQGRRDFLSIANTARRSTSSSRKSSCKNGGIPLSGHTAASA